MILPGVPTQKDIFYDTKNIEQGLELNLSLLPVKKPKIFSCQSFIYNYSVALSVWHFKSQCWLLKKMLVLLVTNIVELLFWNSERNRKQYTGSRKLRVVNRERAWLQLYDNQCNPLCESLRKQWLLLLEILYVLQLIDMSFGRLFWVCINLNNFSMIL